MAKKDRTGNRKIRERRKQYKIPELGYYLIVTDTEATERCFFTGLHQALPENVKNKLEIKVVETKTRAMIDKCLKYGCMLTLVPCQQSKIPGHVARILDEYMNQRPGRSMPRLMS